MDTEPEPAPSMALRTYRNLKLLGNITAFVLAGFVAWKVFAALAPVQYEIVDHASYRNKGKAALAIYLAPIGTAAVVYFVLAGLVVVLLTPLQKGMTWSIYRVNDDGSRDHLKQGMRYDEAVSHKNVLENRESSVKFEMTPE